MFFCKFLKKMNKETLIGAHFSIAGGIYKAAYLAQKIGATTMQIFTSNQKRWASKPLLEEDIQLWHQAIQETNLSHIMSHDSYLINLGSPEEELLQKSRDAFRRELTRCHLLDLDYLNFHPGSAKYSSEQECLDTIIESLLEMEDIVEQGPTRILLETTVGQGTQVGFRFEHLDYIIKNVKHKIPIGVCIDTCHIFTAGYDIRTKKGWDLVLAEFNKIVGLKNLFAFHVNDSLKEFGSKRDRHANIGKGEIGIESFQALMQHPEVKDIPKYLETPNGEECWKEEIQLLKQFANFSQTTVSPT